MKIKMNKNIRIETLVNIMKGIRKLEDTEVFSGALWKSPESIHEDTTIYWIRGIYPGLLIDTGRGYFFVRREMVGMNTNYLSIEDWSGSDWVKYAFDPSDGIYGLNRNCSNVFSGTFMDACGYVLDFWMSR